jgi:leader peptidase (prepilin peptidase)/N-methyltransferase
VTLADLPPSLLRVCALLFGLVWGSFLNVVIHRVPRGMSVVRPPSHCPECGTPIRAHQNLPLLSWLLLRGRARCCGVKISARYPLVEAIAGVLSLAILEVLVLPLHPSTDAVYALVLFIAHFALVLGLTAAAFIDLEFMIVPDSISLGGTVLGLATFSVRNMDLADVLAGAALGFVMVWLPFVWGYAKLRGAPGMGLGDAKLVMLAGAWFGISGTVIVLGAAAVQGALVALVLGIVRGRIDEPEAVVREREELEQELARLPPEERQEVEREMLNDPLATAPQPGLGKARIAFGPFLILATLELLLLGRARVVDWLLL